MTLVRLDIDAFRCLEKVSLTLDSRYNLFIGPNASGKTSLLEALFFLGRGRSFRTRRLDRIVRQGSDSFQLVGRVNVAGQATVVGIAGRRDGTEIRVGGAPAKSAATLAEYFPPQVIDPDVHKLLEDGPNRRRRFLDWGVFHVEHQFMESWQRYHRALKQRNAALRPGADRRAAGVWDAELLHAGTALNDSRQRYVAALSIPLREMGVLLLGEEISLHYQHGWSQEDTFEQAIERSRDRDFRYGITHAGPHRADISVRVGKQVAKDRISRGQQKMVAAGMLLAQLQLQEAAHPGKGALLLDDPAAELDGDRLASLLGVVRSLNSQLFVTSLRPELEQLGQPGAMFHVEQGVIRTAD